MKKLFFLIILTGFFLTLNLSAQSLNLDVNFNDGQPLFTAIHSDAGQPSYTLSVSEGILGIVTAKREQDWSFLGLFSQNIDISALPTLQFRVKSSADVNFVVRLKTKVLTDPEAEMVQIEKSVSLTGGGDFAEFFMDLTEDIAANPDFNAAKIEEIHVECTKGWFESFTGTVSLDYLKIGFAEPVQSKGSAYTETFNGGTVPSAVEANTKYAFEAVDNALKVNVGRDNRWFGFTYILDGSYDITANPILNLDLKSEQEMILQVFLIDANGNGYLTALVGDQYKYHELVANKNEFRTARVYPGDEFLTLSFDFSNASSAIIDLSKITKIKFVSNGTALTFNGSYFIDEIRLGDDAVHKAYIGQVGDKTYPVNAEGLKKILIPEIRNAALISISGAETLISNATVTEIVYKNQTEDGRTLKYGTATLSFNVIPDAKGTAVVTLTASGDMGVESNSMSFEIQVIDNQLPTINPVEDVVVKNGVQTEINLSGITNGDPHAAQSVEITATSDNPSVLETIDVIYISPGRYGTLKFSTLAEGTAVVTLQLEDSEGGITTESFTVNSYKSLNNPPVIEVPGKQTLNNLGGQQSILLSGIGDGDGTSQNLSFTAVSSDAGIIPDPEVVYNQGDNTAVLHVTPTGTTGSAEIELSITDDGGTAENDGNKTTHITLSVEVTKFNPTGFTFNLSDPNALTYFGPEDNGVVYFLAIVDTLGEKALRVTMKDKWTYAGIWMDLPEELNLRDLPIVSYEILSKGKSTWHWNYFYEAEGRDGSLNRNIQNSGDHQFEAPKDEWTTLSFDYRQPGDLNNEDGTPINSSRIDAILFNVHDSKPSWPFTNATGVYYMRNLKFGDQSVYAPAPVLATINPVAALSAYENENNLSLTLTGISNGKGGTDNITVTAASVGKSVADVVSVSPVNEAGEAVLTYKTLASGNSIFNIQVSAEGAEPAKISIKIAVLKNNPAEFSIISVDRSEKHQTMRGFGTFQTDPRFGSLYTEELGASVVRLGIIGNQWEPVNDNDDAEIINMEGFNYDAFNWDYLRELKAGGVETFILTSWSAPAWMKRNLSLDHKEQAIEWEKTDNILEPYYYEEFAESMAALVKALKQEAGIDLFAIGLQNEPYFNEPYPSSILSGPQFVELIKVVGARFEKEGISQVGFYMPEQVFGIGWGGYSNEGYIQTVQNDPVADELCRFFAVHGYDGTGITPGFPNYDRWEILSDLASEGDFPKEMWMTETYIGYADWASALDFAGAVHGSLWAGNVSLWTNWSFDGVQVTKNLPNSTFYTSMNYYKYIRPGAVRIGTNTDSPNLLATAFENADGTFVMVVINKGASSVAARIMGNNLPENYHVYRTTSTDNFYDAGMINVSDVTMIFPPSSVITLVAEENVILTMNQLSDATIMKNSGEVILEIGGISDGNGSVSGLTLELENSNPALFSSIDVSGISSGGTATVSFTPATDQVGTARISLVLSNTDGLTRKMIFYIFVTVAPSVKLDEEYDHRVYPNPASEILHFGISEKSFSQLVISDISGRQILNREITADHTSIDVKNWNKGIYIYRLTGNIKTATGRFIIE